MIRTLTMAAAMVCLCGMGARAEDDKAREKQALDLFAGSVREVLVQHCGKCHSGDEVQGEFDLSTRDGLLKGGTSGTAVVPGHAKDSLLIKLVSHSQKPFMPHEADRLPETTIDHLSRWIDLGASYDKPLVEVTGPPAWTRKQVAPESRTWWSFRPLKPVEPPFVKDAAWARGALDRFILARQEAAGIAPNPPIERRPLIRRAYFDLIGLPPAPEEVEAFVADPDPRAYEKLLDRLLASPHYGERWSRHWLDLSRFAESHGFEHDTDRPTAYHFRDFVIQALNQDLPYDTFVKWQIAGDEYAPENNLALMATGFLAAGVHSTQITKNEVEKHRCDEMDDMLSTIGTSMLGLTIGCARCHDHKYDPFPAADYYRLLSTFTTTVRSEVDLEFDRNTYLQAMAAFGEQHRPLAEALARYEADQLPSALAAWEASRPEDLKQAWVALEPAKFTSKGGATLTRLDDGSILASGKNEQFETYEFVIPTQLTGLKRLRVEALRDTALAKGGPGRAENGNFALSHVEVLLADKDGKNPAAVKLRDPKATFEQQGLPIAAAIDGDPRSAWAIDPEFGKDHAAAFEFDTPIGAAEGAVMTVRLSFQNNAGHNFGRTRLSVSSAESLADLRGPAVPQPVLEALGVPAAQRSAEARASVLKWFRFRDPDWQTLWAASQEHLKQEPKPNLKKVLISTEGLPAVRLHTQGGDFLEATHFLRRGDPNNKDGVAAPGFLQVLTLGQNATARWPAAPPAGWRTSHRRRALTEWLTDVEQGAGSLLARVIVNRLWQQHLGRGIVATPSDFGSRGAPPSHPELLEWLSGELVRQGWKLKPLHKQIMLSATYQQSPLADPEKLKADPDNQWFWRRPRRRLEAEVIRDSILAVSGRLDPTMYGPGTLESSSVRRSIYFTIKRSQLMPMMQVFDCPDALSGIPERPTTTIAPQALLLLNNESVRRSAHALAAQLAAGADTAWPEVVDRGYLRTLGRPPTPAEEAAACRFLEQQAGSYSPAASPRSSAVADFCQVLLCLNEFVYVD